ncbi:threonine ammonia-lyase [Desulfuribacillus alkaliarsenatis]|uniref:L-threonine dehydratase catabolic TdcB n=1 Tax=Desulfuribacillus alkaliarsenatis TaxID=766136 RepID=A0A1E5G6M3_9FIRM|nr:threonine ammonia-lyase [Desulfuribacillus alkaliarsenatis]
MKGLNNIYEQILLAKTRLAGIIHRTPLVYANIFSELSGCQVYMKFEQLQKTGSFKIRGAYNKIMTLTDEEKHKGVIASSAGNHAQGVALAATKASISSTIVMPEGAPLAKVKATKGYGADIVLHGKVFDEAYQKAREIQAETGATFIHAFDDLQIVAGQGTIGIELIEDLPDVDAVLVPVGGGGLISGIGVAIKQANPKIKVIGVEAEGAASMYVSLKAKKPVAIKEVTTIADGIALKEPGKLNYEIAEHCMDDLVTVSDEEIARTMLTLLERNKQMVEPSGATALAALIAENNQALRTQLKGKKVAVILSGGNVDVNLVSMIIEQGLMKAGRYLRFMVSVPDRPGNLQKIIEVLVNQKVNIISLEHFRVGSRITLGRTEIEFVVETIDFDHIKTIKKTLEEKGYTPVIV